MPCYAPNKICYKRAEVQFIKSYYGKIPNTDILKQVNAMREIPVNMSALRHKMRRMRLITGIRLIHWLPEQIQFLLDNYESVGNIELAKKLTLMKLSKRKFTKKHVEKKMVLLGLKRTPESLLTIKNKHKAAGRYPGKSGMEKPEGTVHIRIMANIPHPHVKVGKFFVKQCRVIYKNEFGDIPKGYMVHFADYNTMNLSPGNLLLKKVGDLTFDEKVKMLRIAKENIAKLNAPKTKIVQPIERASVAKPEQKIKVQINDRLTLYVKPGTDIEALKAKYSRPALELIKKSLLTQQFA